MLSGLGATEGGRKSLDRVLAADFDQRVFICDRGGLGIALKLPGIGDLRPIAIGQGAVFFDGLNGGARLAQLPNLVLDLFFGNLDRRLVYNDALIALDGEIGNVFKDGFDVQGRAVFDGQFGHLRLADGLDAEVENSLIEPLGQQALNHVLANLGGKTALEDRIRHLAGAEAGNLGVSAIVPHHGAIGLGNLIGGNVQHQLARAVRVQNRAVLMIVTFVGMVVAFVIVAFVGVVLRGIGRFRVRAVFEGVGRTQRFAFQTRAARR